MQPDNLISLKDDMVAFIAGHGMRRLSAFIGEEVPTVIFEEDNPDGWKDFVEHAKAAGAPFITMSEVVLEKADVAILLDQLRDETFPDASEEIDDAEYLVNHVGKIGYLQLGFAYQGVMFIFEVATDWYDSFQNLMETVSDLGGIVVDNRESDEKTEDVLCPRWAAAMDNTNGRARRSRAPCGAPSLPKCHRQHPSFARHIRPDSRPGLP